MKKKLWAIPLIILILASGLYFLFTQTSIFVSEGAVNMFHDTRDGNARIGEYEVRSSVDTFRHETIYWDGYPIYECKENTCNGILSGTDEQGCELYEGTQTTILSRELNYGSVGCSCKDDCPFGYTGRIGGQQVPCDSPHYCDCTKTETIACGGSTPINIKETCCDYQTCWGKFEIYKDGALLNTVGWLRQGTTSTINFDIQDVTKKVENYIALNSDDGIPQFTELQSNVCKAGYSLTEHNDAYYCVDQDYRWAIDNNLGTLDLYKGTGLVGNFFYDSKLEYGNCQYIQNTFQYIIPKSAFKFHIIKPDLGVVEGENVKIEVIVENTWKPVSGRLDVEFNIPYEIFGISKQTSDTKTSSVDLGYGNTSVIFETPINKFTGDIFVTPTFYVLMKGHEFSGVKGICFEQEDNTIVSLSSCDSILLGTLYGDKFSVTVVSRAEELEQLLTDLKLSIEEKAQIIMDLTSTSEEQSILIDSLGLSVQEQADIINNLNINLQEKTQVIASLTLTSEEQALIINNLDLNIQEQSNLISELTSRADEQANIINNLNINLQEKALLIQQLYGENEKQIELIDEMKLSFSEQATIIDALELTIKEDISFITSLTDNIGEQAEIISNLELTLDEKKDLIDQMELSFAEQATIINVLELTLEEDAVFISSWTDNINEQAEIIHNLELTVEEKEELITKLTDNLEEQQLLLDALKAKEESNVWFWVIVWVSSGFIVIMLVWIAILITKKK